MKKIFFMILAAVLMLITPALATDFEQISVTSSPAVGFTATKISHSGAFQPYAQLAMCTLLGGPILFTTDGTTPTTSASGVGHTMNVGDVLHIWGYADIAKFLAIAVSTTGVLSCSYYYALSAGVF